MIGNICFYFKKNANTLTQFVITIDTIIQTTLVFHILIVAITWTGHMKNQPNKTFSRYPSPSIILSSTPVSSIPTQPLRFPILSVWKFEVDPQWVETPKVKYLDGFDHTDQCLYATPLIHWNNNISNHRNYIRIHRHVVFFFPIVTNDIIWFHDTLIAWLVAPQSLEPLHVSACFF